MSALYPGAVATRERAPDPNVPGDVEVDAATHEGPRPTPSPAPSRARPARRLGPGRRRRGARALGPLIVLALWTLGSGVGVLDPRTLPAPWTVVATSSNLWTQGTLVTDLTTSATRAFWGFLIGLTVGVVLAVLAGLSRWGEATVDGTVQLARSIPTLGLIPLIILWLGIGELFKISIIAVVVMIPIYLNLYAALSNIDNRYVELAETIRLSRWQFLRTVVVPGALPGFFVGLRLGVTGSWLALVVLEQINATNGLGYLMFQAQNYGRVDIILVGLTIYALLGLASDFAVRLIERRVLSWQQTLAG